MEKVFHGHIKYASLMLHLLLEENAYNKGSFTVQKCFQRYEDYVTW